MIAPIHVLVRNVPPLVRDVLEHAIVSQRDMTLIADSAEAPPRAGVPAPDIVITAAPRADESQGVAAALSQWPRVPVLLVMLHGREAVVYELDIRTRELGERSPSELIDTIRRVVRSRRKPKRQV